MVTGDKEFNMSYTYVCLKKSICIIEFSCDDDDDDDDVDDDGFACFAKVCFALMLFNVK